MIFQINFIPAALNCSHASYDVFDLIRNFPVECFSVGQCWFFKREAFVSGVWISTNLLKETKEVYNGHSLDFLLACLPTTSIFLTLVQPKSSDSWGAELSELPGSWFIDNLPRRALGSWGFLCFWITQLLSKSAYATQHPTCLSCSWAEAPGSPAPWAAEELGTWDLRFPISSFERLLWLPSSLPGKVLWILGVNFVLETSKWNVLAFHFHNIFPRFWLWTPVWPQNFSRPTFFVKASLAFLARSISVHMPLALSNVCIRCYIMDKTMLDSEWNRCYGSTCFQLPLSVGSCNWGLF